MPWWGGGSSDDDTSGPSSKTFADESEIAYAAPQGGGMNVGGGASDIQAVCFSNATANDDSDGHYGLVGYGL